MLKKKKKCWSPTAPHLCKDPLLFRGHTGTFPLKPAQLKLHRVWSHRRMNTQLFSNVMTQLLMRRILKVLKDTIIQLELECWKA